MAKMRAKNAWMRPMIAKMRLKMAMMGPFGASYKASALRAYLLVLQIDCISACSNACMLTRRAGAVLPLCGLNKQAPVC